APPACGSGPSLRTNILNHVTEVISPVNSLFAYPFAVARPKSEQQICTAVARILREERLRKKISLNALSARAGLSYQIISYIEREMRTPKLDTLLRIANALGISLSDVIKRAEHESQAP